MYNVKVPRPRVLKRPTRRSFLIEGDLWQKIAEQASREELTPSDILRRIVRQFYASRKTR